LEAFLKKSKKSPKSPEKKNVKQKFSEILQDWSQTFFILT